MARLRFMFLLGFPLPHYPFLWPLPLFLFYISGNWAKRPNHPHPQPLSPVIGFVRVLEVPQPQQSAVVYLKLKIQEREAQLAVAIAVVIFWLIRSAIMNNKYK